ncbi:MAG: efflux RND transporter permease subunit [Helicobacteraceae bacterium]|nr:efflux RND transporter permease subunit [Candidatus Sulfurimonas ponti]
MEKIIYAILDKTWRRRAVVIITLILLGASLMMIPTKLVMAKMLPGKSANTFSIYVDTLTNSSILQTQELTECIEDSLIKEKSVVDLEVYLGQGAPLDYAGLVKGSDFKRMQYQAEIVVNLTHKNTRDEPSFLLIHRIRPLIQNKCASIVPGSTIRFVEMPSGPPTLATIVVELYGTDDKLMRETAEKIAKVFEQTEGLVDIDIMQDSIFSKYELAPNKEKIMGSGLSVEQVNNIIYLAFKGMSIAVKNTRDQQDQIPIFVRLSEETRGIVSNSKEALATKLSALKLMNKMGMMVPLKEVVDINMVKSSPTIFRKNLANMVTVTAECDMVSQVYPLLDAREKLQEILANDFNVTNVPMMSTYMFDLNLKSKDSGEKLLLRWDGEMKVSLDTFRDLGGAFIAALVLIFLLIVIYYRSFALSGIVLAGCFLSIIGVISGHWLSDKIQLIFTGSNFFLTATSLIGFISLMGISARSSLLLIDFSRSLIAKGMDVQRAIAVATATRSKPIMLTAIAIILGSLLLATDPIFGGLGVALIFGSIAATLVSLFFVPVLMYKTKAMLWLKKDEDKEECFSDE